MLNLYWKSGKQTRNLEAKPFQSEAELEKYIFDNQDILGGDIYIVHRQVRTGSKQGIPDMIGVDQNKRVCIIELKNVEAQEDILPQALGYGIWAETNPDSIKAIWLESKEKPEDIAIDWDNMDIRLILIAPSFKATVPRMAGKIGYSIDLMQVRRYGFDGDEFVLVEALEEKPAPKPGVTKVMVDWDWDYYESQHGRGATAQVRKAVEALDTFVKDQGWDMQYNLNKYYTGFKLGNRLVALVAWAGTHAWNIQLKLPQGIGTDFGGQRWEFQRYDHAFHLGIFRPLQPESPQIDELTPLLVQAYKYISGAT